MSTGLTTLPDRVVMGPRARVSSGTTTLLGHVFCDTVAVLLFVSTVTVSESYARYLCMPLGGSIRQFRH